MTYLVDALEKDEASLSFEFFPPKTEQGVANLNATIDVLSDYQPTFVSMTYGAGGSSRDTTRDLVEDIDARLPFPAMPHLTCAGQTIPELRELLESYRDAGIQNILALAGDPPADGTLDRSAFTYAVELIELIRDVGSFSIGVAAFPEGHPRSVDRTSDLRFLAEKLALADFAISQFFMESHHFLNLCEALDQRGINKPILPGVMPFINVAGLRRMAGMNRVHIPDDLATQLDFVDGDANATRQLGVEHAAKIIQELRDAGIERLHLYPMNRTESIRDLDAMIDLRRHR